MPKVTNVYVFQTRDASDGVNYGAEITLVGTQETNVCIIFYQQSTLVSFNHDHDLFPK